MPNVLFSPTPLVLALLLSTTFLVACSGEAAQPQLISHRVGVIHPTSGDGVVHALPILVGLQRAVGDVNRRWGPEGRRLELVVGDGECTERGGLDALQRLVEESGVRVVYAGGCSDETTGLSGYLAERGTVVLTPLKNSGAGDFAYRNPLSREGQARTILRVLGEREYRRFALLSNDTPSAQEFRRAYSRLITSMGGHVIADEVVPAGAQIRKSRKSISTYGALGGSEDTIRRNLDSIFAPEMVRPPGAGDSRSKADRIAALAPDAVVVLAHRSTDAWFLLDLLRSSGFEGPGALNDVIDSRNEFLGMSGYGELIEGFYVPSALPHGEPELWSLADAGGCGSNRLCASAFAGVSLMAGVLRSCEGAEAGCPADRLSGQVSWGGWTFGPPSAQSADDRGESFQVYRVTGGRFIPVEAEREQPKGSP